MKRLEDEERLRHDVISLSKKYGRYGYKRITALLNQEGWQVNHKRVCRIWREERLRVPARHPSGRGYGWATVLVFGKDPNIRIMSGRMILFMSEPTMAGP